MGLFNTGLEILGNALETGVKGYVAEKKYINMYDDIISLTHKDLRTKLMSNRPTSMDIYGYDSRALKTGFKNFGHTLLKGISEHAERVEAKSGKQMFGRRTDIVDDGPRRYYRFDPGSDTASFISKNGNTITYDAKTGVTSITKDGKIIKYRNGDISTSKYDTDMTKSIVPVGEPFVHNGEYSRTGLAKSLLYSGETGKLSKAKTSAEPSRLYRSTACARLPH